MMIVLVATALILNMDVNRSEFIDSVSIEY